MSSIQGNVVVLHALFASATDGVFIKDDNGRYQYINEAGARFLMRSVAQVVGQTDAGLFTAAMQSQLREVEQHIIRTGKAHAVCWRRHEGAQELLMMTQHPFYGEDHQLRGMMGFIQVGTKGAPWPTTQTLPVHEYAIMHEDLPVAPTLPQFAAANLDALKLTRSLLALQAAATAVTASLNLQYVLETFCWELTNLLDAHASYVYEWHTDSETAVRLAYYVVEEWEAMAETYMAFTAAQRPHTSRVIQERYAYQFHVSDDNIVPSEQQQMHARRIETLLLLPMVFQDKVMGLVEIVEHGKERPFTDQEISLAQLLTNQAAAAIANARLYEELDRRLQELASLNQISQAVTSTLDLAKTLTIITDHTLALLRVEAASVALLDGDHQEAWYAAASGKAADVLRGKRMLLTQDGASQAILRGEVLLWADVAANDPYFSLFEQISGFQVRTVLSVPLHAQGEVLGAIQVFNRENGNGRFTQEDVRLLNSLAAPAAAAIANARLYQQARLEITERLRVERQIQASLAEKEVLLKEIHHRVKNNLQVVSSLINLQSDYISDKQAIEIFQGSQNRIRSMALIHEKLYRSDNLARIDMADYIRDLCVYLFRSYSAHERGVALHLNVDNIFLSINTAVPCGLLLNELVSNALKHGFSPRQQGRVTISAHRQSARQVQLQVQDDGVGFPAHIDFRQTTSLGLQLVNTLVGQLDGSITLTHNPTMFTVVFDLPEEM